MTNDLRRIASPTFGSGYVARLLMASLSLTGLGCSAALAADDVPPADISASPPELKTIPVNGAPPASIEVREPESSGEPEHLEEVVVTSTKRNQTVREIPTTINVLSGEKLEREGARQLNDFIDEVPGVKMEEQAGVTSRKIAIRGVGPDDTTNQTVGTVFGDIPLGDPYGNFTTVDPDPFDLQTVEVLKGPQGSLFGASSLAGLIRYVPNAPVFEQWQGKVFAQWTSIHEGGADPTFGAMVNVPVGTSFALRGAGVVEHAPGYINYDTPGYVHPNADDAHKWFGRAIALWQPTDDLSINLLAMKQQMHADQLSAVTNDDYQLERDDSPTANPIRRSFEIAALDTRYSFDWATLVSLTGFEKKSNQFDQDITYNFNAEPAAQEGITLIRARRDVQAHGIVQELRLVSPDEGPWTWLAGAVYSDYDASIDSDVYIPYAAVGTQALNSTLAPLGLGDVAAGVGDQYGVTFGKQVLDPLKAKERALFGELSRALGPVKLTLGGRLYSTEVNGISMSSGLAATAANQMPVTTADEAVKGDGFSPKAAIAWQVDPGILLYSSAAKGFQFGGINVVPIPLDHYPPTYKSATLWSYETGIRTDWFDRTLRVDLSAFYLDWKNAQVYQVGTTGVDSWVDNVGAVTSKGLESTLRYLFPVNGLSIEVSGAYVDARTSTEFTDSQGNAVEPGTVMPNSPPLQTATTLAYSRLLFGSWESTSAFIYTHTNRAWSNIDHQAKLDSRDILNLNLSVGRVEGSYRPTLGFVVANITNQVKKVAITSGTPDTALNANPELYSRPRTYQATLTFDF